MRIAALILAAGLAFTLGGCVKDDGPIVPKPLPSSTPIFASDEEALAAAEEAYGDYQAVEDQISADGGANATRINEVSTGAALTAALEGFQKYVAGEYHSTGVTGFEFSGLQQYLERSADGLGVVAAYVCLDLTAIDVLDAANSSIVSPSRPDFQAFEVSFDMVDGQLLLAARDPWTGSGVCAQ